MSEMRLYDGEGNRLYLTADERDRFIKHARKQRPEERTLAETLAYSGCRISEALELIPRRIELDQGRIIIRSLKKRREDVFRAVPVPSDYLDTLNVVHGLRERQKAKKYRDQLLWSWSRGHAYEIITRLMKDSGIEEGKHRTPKGLRHAYGVNAVSKGVQLNMIQKWMGHASMTTTAIYAQLMGAEEANHAALMWSD